MDKKPTENYHGSIKRTFT